MFRVAAAILLAVQLGGAFGNASATVLSTSGESMQVDIHVEVSGSADSVLAHLALPGEPTLTVPLLEREPGLYGIRTELRAANYAVVFEVLGSPSAQSQPVLLSDLGADIGDGSAVSTAPEEVPTEEEITRWLWLALAFAAGALAVLALLFIGGKKDNAGHDDAAGTGDSDQTSSDSVSIDS